MEKSWKKNHSFGNLKNVFAQENYSGRKSCVNARGFTAAQSRNFHCVFGVNFGESALISAMFVFPFKNKPSKKQRRGFSLVVALVMMALTLLIAISLVSFVVLESQLSGYKVKRYQAQANAICGLRIALGQLQMLTGDDQRVTATADILGEGSNASLPSGTPYKGKRRWTGVWATGGLDKSDPSILRDWNYREPDKKPFLGWLVSGYSDEKENYSPYELAVAKSSIDADKGKELVNEAVSAYDVDDGSTELVTLVGAGTLGKKEGWDEEVVKVRRVPLEKRTDFQKTQKSSGSFAYWVGDEGVKARVNLADNYSQEFNGSLTDWQRTLRATPQRVGTEAIKVFNSFDEWWTEDAKGAGTASATKLPYVLSIGDLAAYGEQDSASFLKDARALYHDVSFYSRGVFSDVYSGGLKTDLSVAFEMPWFSGEDGWNKGFRDFPQFHGSGEKNEMNLLSEFEIPADETTNWWTKQPDDGLGFLYEFDTKRDSYSAGKTNVDKVEILRGPTWDVLRNYYRLYKREIEKKGLRGLKASSEKNWLATGMAPYSYVAGEKTITSTNVDVGDERLTFDGIFGHKWNYANLTGRGSGFSSLYGDGRMFPPHFSGEDVSGKKYLIPQSMRLAPTVIRSIMRFSVVFNQDTAALVFDPIMVLHNPYNVPVEFFGFGSFFTKYYPITFRFNRTDGGTWKYYTNRNRNEDSYREGTSIEFGLHFYTDNVRGVGAHALRIFAGTSDYNTPPNGSIVLQPGEIKPVFPNSATRPLKMMSGQGLAASLGGFDYEEYSNASFELPLAWDKMTEEDMSATFTIDVGGAGDETDMFLYYLFYPKNARGGSATDRKELKRTWNSVSINDWQDYSDETLIQVFGLPRLSGLSQWKQNFSGKTFSRTGETGYDHAQKQFFLEYDIFRVSADESPLGSPLYSNQRPWVVDPRNAESDLINSESVANKNYTNAGVGWACEVRPSTSDFSPIEHNGGNAFWGDSLTSSSGQTNVVLFEVPTRPLTSLGQLQSVDCSITDMDPAYTIGNSYPHTLIENLNLVFDWPDGGRTDLGLQPRGDASYAANLALFDRYFFSGVNCGDEDGQESNISTFTTKLLSGEKNPLASPRVSFIRNRQDQERTDEVVREEFKDPNKIARNFLYEGTFNVNSTSVEAWKAQLASLHKQYLSIDGNYREAEDFPIVRFMNLIGQKAGGNGQNANDSSGDEGEGWRWYRSLSEQDIELLAEKIVEEVRLRGPFMSMADFVNRRLNSTNDSARSGTLQSAIDKTNRINQALGTAKSTPDKKYFHHQIPNNKPSKKPGAPGYLTQGDILSSLGAGMAVRSDTFTIRAYGDVFGLSGKPEARAYCEAVVQRLPDWIADEDDSVLESADNSLFDSLQVKKNYRNQSLGQNEFFFEKFERNTSLKAVNRLLGRRYKIISFRWLSPDEI